MSMKKDFHFEGNRMVFHGAPPLSFVYDDGGREAAGFAGHTGDCVTRAIAIASELPYREVYAALSTEAKQERLTKRQPKRTSPRTGLYRKTYDRWLKANGWEWTPTMGIGTGCTVHLRHGELPMGRLIVRLSGHLSAVIDGVVHDTHDPGRAGERCVYGYFRRIESHV